VTDGRFAGTLLSRCLPPRGFNLQDADVLPQNDNVSSRRRFAAGRNGVGVSGFGYDTVRC